MAGAKGKYNAKTTPQLVFDLTLKYATDQEISKALGIHCSTYYVWLKEKPELPEVISRAKRIRAQKLIPKLAKKARGYTYTETSVEAACMEDPETGEIKELPGKKIRRTRRQIPPDTAALKFFLSNGLPDEFKNRQDLNHAGKIESAASIALYIPDNGRNTDEADD
jgi:hypothetical protein